MIHLENIDKMNEEQRLKYMLILLEGQISSEKDVLANLCNASAIIMALVEKINWSGFYIMKENELVLGPFQGKPACNRVAVGNGVCGTAASTKKIQRVQDVHEFPGHIACDSASNSEIVIPIIKDDNVFGVLDIDSPEKGRFTEMEEKYFSEFVKKIEKSL